MRNSKTDKADLKSALAEAEEAARKKTAPRKRHLPGKREILAFLRENPAAGKRELAKAFSLKSDSRAPLGDILQELYQDGLLPERRRGKKTKRAAEAKLPPVAALEIIGRDADGLLLARPRAAEAEAGETPLVALSPPAGGGGPAAGIGARVLAKIFPAKGEDKRIAPYQGRIIRVLSREPATVLGIIRRAAQGFRLEPADRRQKELLLAEDALAGAQEGDLVIAETQSGGGGRFDSAPRGRVKQRISGAASEAALSAIALYSHNIPVEFSADALIEARAAAALDFSAGREDWRHIPFITIDPETAKDHDDAVFAEADNSKSNPGGHIIYVAIADVGAYIRPGSALDAQARRRGNSVYFPDRVVPMLPEEISNNLCSLREGEERPAFAARIVLSAQGQMLRHSFHRIVMRSRAKLSYEQAQAAADGKADEKTAPLRGMVLRPLARAYQSLRAAREKRQPLELNLPERKLFLDENGHLSDIRAVKRLDSHRLIEEFMIAANIAAAETLKAKNRPLLFRIHDSPSPAKQEVLREFLRGLGLKLGSGAQVNAARLNGILAQAEGKSYEEMVNQVVLRSQAQAEYSPDNIGHFGLKLRNYAHFTSPIRRYADLLAHRALIKVLGLGEDGITKEEEARLAETAAEISAAERRAQAAERETNDRLIAEYLSAHIGAEFSGRINGATRAGLFITLDKTGADGLAPIASLPSGAAGGQEESGGGARRGGQSGGGREFYYFDEAHFALIGRRSGKGYQLGDAVRVRLMSVQKTAGALRFALLSPPKKLPFSAKSFHKATHSRRPQRPFKGGRR